MPKNYYLHREERSMLPDKINVGEYVFIVEKHMQGSKYLDQLVLGKVKNKLSNGDRYKNGAKQSVIPISKETRNKIKPILDEYFKNGILKFNDTKYDISKTIEWFNKELDAMSIDLDKECDNYDGELVVGRVQYFLYPSNYCKPPKKTSILIGVKNNIICDLDTLKNQIEYVKSNYYIDDLSYIEKLNKLIEYRNLIKIFDNNKLNDINIHPNYLELIIEDDKYIKDTNYREIK